MRSVSQEQMINNAAYARKRTPVMRSDMSEKITALLHRDEEIYSSLPQPFLEGVFSVFMYPLIHRSPRLHEMQALRWLKQHADAELTPELMLEMYSVLTAGTELDGKGFRDEQCNIIGEEFLFVTASAGSIPEEAERICRKYAHLNEGSPCDLEDVFRFSLEFICLHPFPDGNGRSKVLLIQFLLSKMGFKCSFLLPFDAIQSRIRISEVSQTAVRCAGIFYGQKPYEFAPYVDLMISILQESYQILENAVREF